MNSIEDTDEWEYGSLAASLLDGPRWRPVDLQIDAFGLSHRGLVRSDNEDHFLTARFGRFLEAVQSNIATSECPAPHQVTGHALIVADGMGGEAAGEIASRSAIKLMFHLAADLSDWIFRLDDPQLSDAVERRAAERMEQVSAAMTQEAQADPVLSGFGTTLAMAWGVGEHWLLVHVGDSRIYLFRDGALQQLTRDHTVAQELADAGAIEQHQVRFHRMRNRLTRLLGDQVQNVAPVIQRLTLQHDDCLLLCTDGLTGMVPAAEIAKTLASGDPADACCARLVAAALAAGGKDNVTVVVARMRIQHALSTS